MNTEIKRTMIGFVVGFNYNNEVYRTNFEVLLNQYGEWSNQHKTDKEKTKVFENEILANKFIQKHQKNYNETLYIRKYYRTEFI